MSAPKVNTNNFFAPGNTWSDDELKALDAAYDTVATQMKTGGSRVSHVIANGVYIRLRTWFPVVEGGAARGWMRTEGAVKMMLDVAARRAEIALTRAARERRKKLRAAQAVAREIEATAAQERLVHQQEEMASMQDALEAAREEIEMRARVEDVLRAERDEERQRADRATALAADATRSLVEAAQLQMEAVAAMYKNLRSIEHHGVVFLPPAQTGVPALNQ